LKDFIPRKDSEFMTWIENFVGNLKIEYAKLGFTETEFSEMNEIADNFRKTLKINSSFKNKAKEITDFKNKLRNQKKYRIPIETPKNDLKINLKKFVVSGVERRFRLYIKRIKSHPNYTDAIGKILQIT
jgi:hypothetical protein